MPSTRNILGANVVPISSSTQNLMILINSQVLYKFLFLPIFHKYIASLINSFHQVFINEVQMVILACITSLMYSYWILVYLITPSVFEKI